MASSKDRTRRRSNRSFEVIEVTDAEFRDTLIEAFKQNMGPQLEDEKTRKALLEQIDIAVSTVKVKYPELTPQNQLKMSQQPSCSLIEGHWYGNERGSKLS